MRVVLDTNVLLSACLKPSGLEAQVVDMAIGRVIESCVSGAVLDEYSDVLFREKFAAVRARARVLLDSIAGCSVLVHPEHTATAALDEDDNRFLECAAAAGASYLITGNLRHYPEVFGSCSIVNARRFADAHLRVQDRRGCGEATGPNVATHNGTG